MKYLIKTFVWLEVLLLSTSVFAEGLKPLIAIPSNYRTIDTKSKLALEWGIKGVGVGNIIFSSKELPLKQEDKYGDIRDTFYFGKDASIHCRVYYPGTIGSLIKIVESQVKNAKFVKHWSIMTVISEKKYNEAKMSSATDQDLLGWDTQRFDLLPFAGGDEQDFNAINLSDENILEKGDNVVEIKVFLKFQTGTKWVSKVEGDKVVTREEPVYVDYLIANGKFNYIVEK